MLPLTSEDVRVFLHVAGALGWVGGQFVLAGIVPAVRRQAPDALTVVARRFQIVSWPFYALLLATGIWNALEVNFEAATTAWISTFGVKMWLVILSGVGAAGHALVAGPRVARARSDAARRRARALSGALAGVGLLAGVGAVLLGVMLSGA